MDQNARLSVRGNGGNGGETPEFKKLLDMSMEELRLKTMGHQAGWGFGKSTRWSLDQSRGDLPFTFDDGVVATCPAQFRQRRWQLAVGMGEPFHRRFTEARLIARERLRPEAPNRSPHVG